MIDKLHRKVPRHRSLVLLLAGFGLLAYSLIGQIASAQNWEKRGEDSVEDDVEQSAVNPAFFRPSSAEAVANAIRLQHLTIRKETRQRIAEPLITKQLIGKPPLPTLNAAMRREQSENGVITLTNRRRPGQPVAPPATEHTIELKKVLEESSVVSPLKPMPSIAQLSATRGLNEQTKEDIGLDVALTALVAVGLAFLGISVWQRSRL